MDVQMIMTGISVVEHLTPVAEKVFQEIGPTVQTEIKDGKAVWVDLQKAWDDFKAALDIVKSSVPLG